MEVFRSVMIAGTVVGAARLLSVTQPAVSRAIALLEMRLGYALFERRGRRVVPTAEAEALYREVESSYAGIERITQVALDLKFQRAGSLRVATLPALAQWLVPRAVGTFLQKRPAVSVFVQTLPSRQIAALVATRQLDVGLVELPLTASAIRAESLPEAPIVAVMPRTHPLSRKRVISLTQLGGERMIMLSRHSFVRYQIDEAFAKAGVTPHVAAETPTSFMVCPLVSAGVGIGLVSRLTALPFAEQLAIVPLRERLRSRYAFIYPEGVPESALTRAFVDAVSRS